jgi:2-dehydro-3-deoxyphosphogluconate aldolase/(4S)-4-hydroxy-2-oxoglutarate aldolase
MSARTPRSQVKAAITDGGVVGIVRTTSADHAIALTREIWAAGIDVVEVALTTPGGLAAIETLAAETRNSEAGGGPPGGRIIGAGTVLDATTARLAVLAGAELIVTPTLMEEVIQVGHRYGVVTVVGCATPTEMLRATTLGADLVKVFPANLWTPALLADVLAALPQLECLPTGGVSPDTAADWIRAGAVAVGIGSALTKAADPAAGVRALLAAIRDARTTPVD